MLVVNLFGSAGAGKSSGMAKIFYDLKTKYYINAEQAPEFAKEKVWEENTEVFKPDNQLYLLGKQFYRISRLRDKVDVVVTDSPLPLCIFYNKSPVLGYIFNILVMQTFNSFDNINFFIERNKPYNPKGRFQTEEESDADSIKLKKILDMNNIQYTTVYGDEDGYQTILDKIIERINGDSSQ